MNVEKDAPLPSFINFGRYGDEYDTIFNAGFVISSALWESSEFYNGRPLHEVVREEMSFQSLWATLLNLWGQTESILPSHMSDLLHRFGMTVMPIGERASLENFILDERGLFIEGLTFKPREEQGIMPEYLKAFEFDGDGCVSDMNSICFGPFSDSETDFIKQYHPRLFEVGAGTMYAANHFRESGLDVLAVDVAAYTISEVHYPWQSDEDRKMLAIPSYRELLETESSERTLLMSWPQPQAGYPGTVLELYRKSGGKNLLFKIGALFGQMNNGLGRSTTPALPAAKWKIVDELIAHWEIDPKLRYEPWLNHNALTAFKLRD